MRMAFTGFLLDKTGYGEASRRLLASLLYHGQDVSIGTLLTDGSPQMDPPAWLKNISHGGSNPDVQFICSFASDFPLFTMPGIRNIGLTTWETSELPRAYVAGAESVDAVVVPCEQNRKLFESEGIEHVYVVPHPMDYSSWESKLSSALEIDPEIYLFYTICNMQERKNPEGLLTAYLTTFTGYDKVKLVIKLPGTALEVDRFGRLLRSLVDPLEGRLNIPNPPLVEVVSAWMGDEDVRALHARGDCLVALSKGEGFGIPILDALTCGSRVVVTDWGGHTDYLPHFPGCHTVKYRMAPVVQRFPHFTAHMQWADPDVLDAGAEMRAAFELGRRVKDSVRPKFLTFDSIGRQLIEVACGDGPN